MRFSNLLMIRNVLSAVTAIVYIFLLYFQYNKDSEHHLYRTFKIIAPICLLTLSVVTYIINKKRNKNV